MKSKILFIAIIVLQTITAFSQDMATLKTEALKSYKASVTMNFDDIFETTYPKLFDVIPKDQMKEMFSQMMENEQFTLKLVEVEPNFSFSEIKTVENKKFCIINHRNALVMTFKSPIVEVEEMKNSFKEIMGAETIDFDKATNSFRVESRAILLAVSDELTKGTWKFLNKDKDNVIFAMVFNDKIQKELGF